jgi:hypothetical protein
MPRASRGIFFGEIIRFAPRAHRDHDVILPQDEKNVARSPFGHVAITPRASLELCSEGNGRVTRINFRAALPTITDNRLAFGEQVEG